MEWRSLPRPSAKRRARSAQFVVPFQGLLEAALRLVRPPLRRQQDQVDAILKLVLGQEVSGETLKVLREFVVVAEYFLHSLLRVFDSALKPLAVVCFDEVSATLQRPSECILADNAYGGESDLQGGASVVAVGKQEVAFYSIHFLTVTSSFTFASTQTRTPSPMAPAVS